MIVLVPISTTQDAQTLAGIWAPLARQEGGSVTFVHVVRPLAPWRPGDSPEDAAEMVQQAAEQARTLGVNAQAVVIPGYDVAAALREVARDQNVDLLLLRWSSHAPALRRGPLGPVLDSLLDSPPCDVVVVRGDVPAEGPRRILIPTAGGPNVRLAVRVARTLAAGTGGAVTLLYVHTQRRTSHPPLPPAEVFRTTLGDLAGDPVFTTRVVEARGAVQGIREEAAQGYDLLFIGATEEGMLRRVLVGDVPLRVADGTPIPLAIAKRRAPRAHTLARRAWHWVDRALPDLSEGERADLYRRLRESTRAELDFHLRIGLSATIAALGMLLNSPAVIIGAMLVAPLMSATLAVGLGVTSGDGRLVRRATLRTLQGALIVVVIAALVAWVDPAAAITSEVAARARPTLLDLGVALASGMAGAYAVSRKDVQEALPGVAIAVALVPPLAAVGISLALGEWRVAAGALLLYATNMVSIAGVGGFTFLLMGFRPRIWSSTRLRVFWRGVFGLSLLLLLLLLPLGWLTQRSLAEARLQRQIDRALRESVQQVIGQPLMRYTWEHGSGETIWLDVQVQASRQIRREEAVALQDAISARLQRPVGLDVVAVPVIELDPKVSPAPAHTPAIDPGATPTRQP